MLLQTVKYALRARSAPHRASLPSPHSWLAICGGSMRSTSSKRAFPGERTRTGSSSGTVFTRTTPEGSFVQGVSHLASAAGNIREGIFPVGFYDEVVRCSGVPIRGGGPDRRQREHSSSGL